MRGGRWLWLGAAGILVAGCVHAGAAGPDPRSPIALYPLAAGHTWTFRVTRPGAPGASTTVTRVSAVDGHRVRIRSGTTRYAFFLRADGIYRPAQNAYLLKGPVKKGARWPAPFGGTDLVTAVEQTVTVPAGTFHRCVVVDERVPVARIHQVHTFCPGVGPVRLVQFEDGAKVAEAVLVAYSHPHGS